MSWYWDRDFQLRCLRRFIRIKSEIPRRALPAQSVCFPFFSFSGRPDRTKKGSTPARREILADSLHPPETLPVPYSTELEIAAPADQWDAVDGKCDKYAMQGVSKWIPQVAHFCREEATPM